MKAYDLSVNKMQNKPDEWKLLETRRPKAAV